MMNLRDYLNPVSIEKPEALHIAEQSQFSRILTVHTESRPVDSIKGYSIAIVGVIDERMSPEKGTAEAPDSIRRSLYPLARIPGKIKIADLGNLKNGASFNDTISGLTDLLNYLHELDIFVILIGTSTPVIQAVDRVFSSAGRRYCLSTIDSRIDYNPEKKGVDFCNSLGPLFQSGKSNISNFINIGYQTYLNDQQTLTRLLRKQYELMRLGDVRQAIHLTEPLFRDSDATFFDICAVRQADAPGTFLPSPNGLYAEEACLLARYSGVSDKMKVFGLLEVNPARDRSGQTVSLAAQILWFFFESYAQKQIEDPALSDSGNGRFTKYHINVDDMDEEMIFIKSNYTERWWIELSGQDNKKQHISCSYEDYLKANNNEVPDKWLRSAARLRQD